jgi:hypothetical protein
MQNRSFRSGVFVAFAIQSSFLLFTLSLGKVVDEKITQNPDSSVRSIQAIETKETTIFALVSRRLACCTISRDVDQAAQQHNWPWNKTTEGHATSVFRNFRPNLPIPIRVSSSLLTKKVRDSHEFGTQQEKHANELQETRSEKQFRCNNSDSELCLNAASEIVSIVMKLADH